MQLAIIKSYFPAVFRKFHTSALATVHLFSLIQHDTISIPSLVASGIILVENFSALSLSQGSGFVLKSSWTVPYRHVSQHPEPQRLWMSLSTDLHIALRAYHKE